MLSRSSTLPRTSLTWTPKGTYSLSGNARYRDAENDELDFSVRFFNPDGGEYELCGNGARCLPRFAEEIGFPLILKPIAGAKFGLRATAR